MECRKRKELYLELEINERTLLNSAIMLLKRQITAEQSGPAKLHRCGNEGVLIRSVQFWVFLFAINFFLICMIQLVITLLYSAN
jgi:hypothetical protein